jgi:hypothetical protein
MIGYYYTNDEVFCLYQTGMFAYNWVTNICYYDTNTGKYYSPNIKNIIANGRDLNGGRFNVNSLSKNIVSSHSSFVMT